MLEFWVGWKFEIAFIGDFTSFLIMTRIQMLKKEAMGLTDSERATLASELLYSLPATLSDEDEGVAEALRRDAELSSNSSTGISWNEIKKELGRD